MAQQVPKDVDEAITTASDWMGWKPEDSMYPKEDGKKALEDGKTFVEKVDAALSKGLAATASVETHKGTMNITEARAMCVSVRDAGQRVFGDLTAAEEAQYEPFRKILSEDKLNLYNERLKKYKLYGANGKVLKTPEIIVTRLYGAPLAWTAKHRARLECRLLALQGNDKGGLGAE